MPKSKEFSGTDAMGVELSAALSVVESGSNRAIRAGESAMVDRSNSLPAGLGHDMGASSSSRGSRDATETPAYADAERFLEWPKGEPWIDERELARAKPRRIPERQKPMAQIHSGVGPRNYTRPDEFILDDLCTWIEGESEIDARHMDIECRNGVVTFSGSVPARDMKDAAESGAKATAGVKKVQNRLKIE
jgi:hypothetical protein